MKTDEQYVSERYEAQVDSYNSIVFRLDPTPTLELIRAKLLSMKYSDERQEYVVIPGLKPKMSVQGVEELMLELQARMSVDKALSNLDRNEINTIMRQVGEVLLEFKFFKVEIYNISESDWANIDYMIMHSVKTYLNRALNGKENELLAKSFQQKEQITRSGTARDDAPQQRGFIK